MSGSAPDVTERVESALASVPHEWRVPRDGMAAVELDREHVHDALGALRDAGFQTVTFVTAIDHHPAEPRFEIVWQLLSVPSSERVRLSVRVPEEDAVVPTCTDLWPGAAYAERECWDLFGVRFEGHAGLKRLLMPEGYDHHPLRKDFPHQGIQPDRLYREWDRERRREWRKETR